MLSISQLPETDLPQNRNEVEICSATWTGAVLALRADPADFGALTSSLSVLGRGCSDKKS